MAKVYSDVMVDLETTGQGAGCGILSIGATAFRADMPEADWKKFYMGPIDRGSCKRAGLREDDSTLRWWEEQAPEARKVFIESSLPRISTPILMALTSFSMFFPPNARLWGNGSDFDNAILSYAYMKLRIDQPWEYRNNRCYRTLKAEFPSIFKAEPIGVAHHALDDAMNQARHLVRILNEIHK